MALRNYKPKTKPALWVGMRGGSKPRSLTVRPEVERQKREARRAEANRKRRIAEPKRRKRVNSTSQRQRARNDAYNARVKVWKTERPVCDICLRGDVSPGQEPRPTQDCHHQRGKLGPLLMDERFWIPVCRPHHAWIDANRDLARAMGLLCARGEWNVPMPPSD